MSCILITLGIDELDQECVYHSSIDHEFFSFSLKFDFLNKFSSMFFNFIPLFLDQELFFLCAFIFLFQFNDLFPKVTNLRHFGFHATDIILERVDLLFVFAHWLFILHCHLVIFFLVCLDGPLKIMDSLFNLIQFTIFALNLSCLPLYIFFECRYLLFSFFKFCTLILGWLALFP